MCSPVELTLVLQRDLLVQDACRAHTKMHEVDVVRAPVRLGDLVDLLHEILDMVAQVEDLPLLVDLPSSVSAMVAQPSRQRDVPS